MGLDIRTVSFFVGALSAVQALSIFVFARMVGRQPGIYQNAYGNLGLAFAFSLTLLRGVIPDFLSIVVANTIISISGFLIFDGVCAYTGRAFNRKPLLIIPGFIFLFFLYFTYIERSMSVRTILISVTSAIFCFACGYILYRYSDKQLRLASLFTANVLVFYGLFLLFRSLIAAIYPLPDDLFINTNFQVLVFLLMAFCGLLWSVGFALMMAQRLLIETRRVAMTDYLTGILNRKAGHEALEREIERREKEAQQFSILLIDIDHFKRVNDIFGHSAGDLVLQSIADVLKSGLRKEDTLCRWGGEEFLFVLTGASQAEAFRIAERLRETIAQTRVPYKNWEISCTISLGVAGTWEQNLEVDELLARADRSLYEAKSSGRNRVVLFEQFSKFEIAEL
jgi:diguanylate cyclase (GGDEF)-like protein